MKVAFTARAEQALEAIGDFIARDNPRQALAFIDDLREQAMSLADTPLRFPVIPRFERQGIRRRAHRGYLIFYRIRDEQIEILHVVHGARDYEALLFPEA